MKYLFLAIPNDFGSTLLWRHLNCCKNGISLPKEGHYYWGSTGRGSWFKKHYGPMLRSYKFSRAFALEKDKFIESNFNWDIISTRWHKDWTRLKPKQYRQGENTILVEKTTFNIIILPILLKEFRPARAIVSIRNPYAMIEGMLYRRNWHSWPRNRTQCLIEAATHWVSCAENYLKFKDLPETMHTTYEQMTGRPQEFSLALHDFMPELSDFNFDKILFDRRIHNLYNKPLRVRNLNYDQIVRLSEKDFDDINLVLDGNSDLMQELGYSKITSMGE